MNMAHVSSGRASPETLDSAAIRAFVVREYDETVVPNLKVAFGGGGGGGGGDDDDDDDGVTRRGRSSFASRTRRRSLIPST